MVRKESLKVDFASEVSIMKALGGRWEFNFRRRTNSDQPGRLIARAVGTHCLCRHFGHFVQACADRMSKISTQFGLAVRKLRKQIQLTQEELASRCGLHRTYLTDIERGARNPSLKIIERIAAGLGISIPGLMRSIR